MWYVAAPMKMRTVALYGASLLVTLATACSDDGGNNNGTCGDGHTTGSEQCDDGNTANGDGCSSSCKNESSGPRCGDNNVDVASEQCDDGNTTSGDGCSATCQNEGSGQCGNGAINGAEMCDDANTTNGDGCSSTCVVESGYTCTGTPSVCTMPQTANGTCASPFNVMLTGTTGDLTATLSGDTTTGTSQVAMAACDGFGDEGDGHDQIYKIITTDVRDLKITLTSNTMSGAIVRLLRTPCDVTTEILEYTDAEDGCADLDGSGYLGYVNLPAGTYYIVVDTYAAGEEGTYEVEVVASLPGCGNGVPNGAFEFCDDGNTMAGDGCNVNCEVETGYNCIVPGMGMPSSCHMKGCGDGVIDAMATVPEQCDDLNTVSGDRCSSTCQLEFDTTEANEPNDTVPQVLTAVDHIVKGELVTDTDADLYSFTLTAPTTVTIETYDTIDGTTLNYVDANTGAVGNNKFDCKAVDTEVSVFPAGADPTMPAMGLVRDDDDGAGYCSYLGAADSIDDQIEMGADPTQLVMLPAGTYTIRVGNYSNTALATPGPYVLDIKFGGTTATPVAPAPGDLILNEVMTADNVADTNCDGVTTSSNDEFVEIVNVSNKTLDLSGITVRDNMPNAGVVRFTFGLAGNLGTGTTTLAPGKAVVVWGGGMPNCPGVTNWFVNAVANQGTLGFNDGGEQVTLMSADSTPVELATATFGAATLAVSFNRSPDITGTTYALHNAVTGHVGDFSPGKKVDGTAF